MTYGFAPLLPLMFFVPLLVVAALFIGYGLWRKLRGAWLRALALAALALAIANPSIFVELRDPLSTIVAIVVDRSQSQQNGDRTAQTDRAVEGLKARLAGIPLIEPRIIEAADLSRQCRTVVAQGVERLRLADRGVLTGVRGVVFVDVQTRE